MALSISNNSNVSSLPPTETSTKNVDLLAVRVMRLSKPALFPNVPIYGEEESSSFLQGQSRDIAIGNDHSVLSQLLILPYSFGNVFLGEIFSAIVSLHNQGDQNLRDVILKTDIQTATQRISLNSTDPNEPTKVDLKPDESFSRVLQHEVKELGNHSLVCTVSCIDQNGETKPFKKVFKLPVTKPIDLKTRFVSGPKHDEFYVVADIQNQTPTILNMTTVEFEPTTAYSVTNLSHSHHQENSFGDFWHLLRPNEILSYMFYVRPRPDCSFDQLHMTTTLGKLDIVWMSGFGERGRLQTNQLPKPVPSITTTNLGFLPDLRIFLLRGQGRCSIDESQTFVVRIFNCTQRPMELSLSFDPMFSKRENFIWIGVTTRHLGRIEPHQTFDHELQLVPLSCGLKRIGGLRVTDLSMRHTYDLDDFHQLLVVPKPVQ